MGEVARRHRGVSACRRSAVGYRKLAIALAERATRNHASIRSAPNAPRAAAELSRTWPASVRRRSMAPDGAAALFGHSMGAVVAFEFARIAESRGAAGGTLWASAAPGRQPSQLSLICPPPRRSDRRYRDFVGPDAELLADPDLPSCWSPRRADYAGDKSLYL